MPSTKRTSRTKPTAPRVLTTNVTLKKMADEGALPPQAVAILGTLKAKGGKLTVEELKKSMQGRVESKQSMSAIWAFYRSRLTRKGFIACTSNREGK